MSAPMPHQQKCVAAPNVIHHQTRGETPHTNLNFLSHFVWGVSPGGVSRLGVDYVTAEKFQIGESACSSPPSGVTAEVLR